MSNSITDMQLFFMGLHENDQTFSCKNTDQLSSLWAAFTKCKRNIRDGLRLENMSWRLWSRQAIMMRKRLESETAIVLPEFTTPADTTSQQQSSSSSINSVDYTKDMDTNNTECTTPRLVRTRSLPSLSCQAQHIMDSCHIPPPPSPTATTTTTSSSSTTSLLPTMDPLHNGTTKECSAPILTFSLTSSSPPPLPPKRSKFYIHQGGDDDDHVDGLDDIEESDVESMYNHDDGDYFDDMDSSCYSSDSTACSSPSSLDGGDNKPTSSLLTDLLQKDNTASCELRRSNCCERLDLWFSGALSS